MPALAPPWLAGTHDGDRAAARAAQDALKQTFSTPEKLQNVSKLFQKDIVGYCRDVVQNETVQSLSDERSVSKDDAEATYARVIASSLAVVSRLILDLPLDELDKQRTTYEELLGEEKLWAFASYNDVSVRRALFRLARNALDKKRGQSDLFLLDHESTHGPQMCSSRTSRPLALPLSVKRCTRTKLGPRLSFCRPPQS